MPDHEDLHSVLSDWTAREARGDTAALDSLLAEDFTAVGPLGFILSKQDWLDRHRNGALMYQAVGLEDVRLRVHGDTAVAIALQTAQGAYQGHLVPAALRTTVVLTHEHGRWQLAVAHMSFIAGTPGAPPIPGHG